jgi:glycosyltransferase involved in cell wall biosynthesis
MHNNSSITICLISPVPPPSGGMSNWTDLIHRYVKCRGEVDFIQVNTATRWRRIDDLAIWKRIIGGTIQLIINLATLVLALLKKPDLIHLSTSGGIGTIRDLVVLATTRFFNVPAVYHLHFVRIPDIAVKKTFEWNIMSIALRLADVVIAIDKATSDVIAHHLPEVIVKNIPNPIDFSRLPVSGKTKAEKNCVLFLGWIIPTKGVEELIEAWSALALKGWVLQLAGPGSLDYRRKLALQFNPQNLDFLGEVTHEQAMLLMSQSDIFILPSHTEGFPIAVLEAMATGNPIIASSVGAIPEMLSEDCGILIEPKNTVGIKDALLSLTQDKYLRTKLGENAREKARQYYSIDIVFSEYLNIWKSLSTKK